jgi:ATP-dependent DNA ligase
VLNVPKICEAAVKAIATDVVLAGELCCFVGDRSASHREVSAAIADPSSYDVRFGVFDILSMNGSDVESAPKEKSELIAQIVRGNSEVFVIQQHVFTSRKEILEFYTSAKQDGAEGVIVRIPSSITYKIKQILSLDLVILGFAEGSGDRKGMLRELLLGFALGDDRYQIVTKCGGGFSDADRKGLLVQLDKLATPSEYTEVSGAKTAFVFVRPEVVVEISCLDLINETTDGPVRKACLSFDSKNGYSSEGNRPTLSVISPNFVRIRTDKQCTPDEAGTAQAYTLVEPLERAGQALEEPLSTVVKREVYTKSGKGGTAVRKFVGIQTNKETSGAYPVYVVVFTDFSGGRKTPLEQEIYLCASEADVEQRFSALREEHIKKGWELSAGRG